jgi:N-acetyl-anhydromuramyl-L-alanine amidase AmpD
MLISPYCEDYITALGFDEDGWLVSNDPDEIKVIKMPTPKLWKGMHPDIQKNYGNRLAGSVTHYDALGSALRTAKGFSAKGGRSASTGAVIDRYSSINSRFADIYVLASIHDRTWHAGFNFNAGDVPYTLPNGVVTKSPNQWFFGLDLSNWGDLRKDKQGRWCAWPGTPPYSYPVANVEPVKINGRYWEPYTEAAINSYKAFIAAISMELSIPKEWHVGHSDLSPKRKIDPGPHLYKAQLLDEIYTELAAYTSGEFLDPDRAGLSDDI